MDKTIGYVVCCQSPALFLTAVVLLLCFFARRRAHHVRAVLDLALCILAAAGGVALYFLGMGRDHFSISDFYIIRAPGWVGLAVVALIAGWAGIRAFGRVNRARLAQKEANRAANARHFAGEQQEKAANAAAVTEVAQVVEAAVSEKNDAVLPAENVLENDAIVSDTETNETLTTAEKIQP